MNPGYLVALGVFFLALCLFIVRRRSNPYVVGPTLVPLALLPMLVSSLSAVRTVIDGFRQMALAETGGLELVSNVLLSANDIALSGELASLGVLAVLGALSLAARRFFTPDAVETAANFQAKLITAIAVVSLLLSLSVGAYLQRSLGLPLAVIAPVSVLEDPNAPRTMRSAETLELLDPEALPSMGEVSSTIASRWVSTATFALLAIGLSVAGFAVSAAASFLGPTFSRSTAVTGAALAGLGLLAMGALIVSHRAYAAELAYVIAQFEEVQAGPGEQ